MTTAASPPSLPDMGSGALELADISKTFGTNNTVGPVSLSIKSGEFFSLLGPSGCGKTTTLRMIAGFEFPDSGEIRLDGVAITDQPANRRRMNLVFQRYELFPHMSVERNIGYGLRVARVPKAEITERVGSMMDVVGVTDFASRRADELSGGQQQRVALARALVNRPSVLLLDEPLSALDVKLRERMQLELKSIQATLGTTFIYVTHDQDEAMMMSDRIGVMHNGRLVQVGTPREIYEDPATDFVATFVGTTNELRISATKPGRYTTAGATIELPATALAGEEVTLRVRPENVLLLTEEPGSQHSFVDGTVRSIVYLGATVRFFVETEVGTIECRRLSSAQDETVREGDRVRVAWDHAAI